MSRIKSYNKKKRSRKKTKMLENISNVFTNLQNADGSTDSNKLDINGNPLGENFSDNVEYQLK
jgi:hypothetical protein